MSGQVSRLGDRAFAALRTPARSAKPREHGLTIAADRGIGTLSQVKDERSRRWFIENLRPETNFDVEAPDLVPLELARRGPANRGLTGLVAGAAEAA